MNISDSEREIMQVIWNSGGKILFAGLTETLKQNGKNWSDKTVSTFLSRLADKGMLRIEKQGRINCYIAQHTEKEYRKMITGSFVGKEYGGNTFGLLQQLISEHMSEEDIEELEAFWKEVKKK